MSVTTHRPTEKTYTWLSPTQFPGSPRHAWSLELDRGDQKGQPALRDCAPSSLSPPVPAAPSFRPEPSDQPPFFLTALGCSCENTAPGLTPRHPENRGLRTSASRRSAALTNPRGARGLRQHKRKRKHPEQAERRPGPIHLSSLLTTLWGFLF